MDRMELSRVSTMADDDSLDERFTEPGDCEKATLSRSVTDRLQDSCFTMVRLLLKTVTFRR